MFSIKAMTKIVDYVKNQLHTIKSATTKARTLAVRAQLFLIQKTVQLFDVRGFNPQACRSPS